MTPRERAEQAWKELCDTNVSPLDETDWMNPGEEEPFVEVIQNAIEAATAELQSEYKALEEQRNELYQEHMNALGKQSAAGRAQIDRIVDFHRKQHAEEIAALKAQHAQELAARPQS